MRDRYPVVSAQVAARVVDDQAVLVLADSGEVQILNEVGAVIWELVDGRHSVGEIADKVAADFDVTQEEAFKDVKEFLAKLANAGAIELVDRPTP